MTNTETQSAELQGRVREALAPLQGTHYHLAPLTHDAVVECVAAGLLPQHRRDVLNEAIEAARGEYLHDQTGTPEDEAYNQAVSDVVAAIGALLEGK
jgi:hypothetical protein